MTTRGTVGTVTVGGADGTEGAGPTGGVDGATLVAGVSGSALAFWPGRTGFDAVAPAAGRDADAAGAAASGVGVDEDDGATPIAGPVAARGVPSWLTLEASSAPTEEVRPALSTPTLAAMAPPAAVTTIAEAPATVRASCLCTTATLRMPLPDETQVRVKGWQSPAAGATVAHRTPPIVGTSGHGRAARRG